MSNISKIYASADVSIQPSEGKMVEQVTANAKEMDLPLFRKPDVSVASVSLNANSVLVTSQVNSSECVGNYAPSSVPLTEKPLVLHSINIPLNVSLAHAVTVNLKQVEDTEVAAEIQLKKTKKSKTTNSAEGEAVVRLKAPKKKSSVEEASAETYLKIQQEEEI